MERFSHPPESYSRKLDEIVAKEEMPYGYVSNPPPADTGNFNQRRLECDKRYRVVHGQVR